MTAVSNLSNQTTRPILSRWPRLTRLPLALEITLALLLKIAILFALWNAFFSQPQAKHMLLPTAQVEQHLLANATNSDSYDPKSVRTVHSNPSSIPQSKAQHGSH
ncbi:MAG: hypothetical protein HHJ09_05180 [Glaciimonas sp.]|nr:hypothetical protein [Glaciimonas sp.]